MAVSMILLAAAALPETSRGRSARHDIAEESDIAIAQLIGRDGLDADADLLIAADFRAQLKQRAAAGDGEAGLSRAEIFAQREFHVQTACIQLQIKAVTDGKCAVDRRNRIAPYNAHRRVAQCVCGGKMCLSAPGPK